MIGPNSSFWQSALNPPPSPATQNQNQTQESPPVWSTQVTQNKELNLQGEGADQLPPLPEEPFTFWNGEAPVANQAIPSSMQQQALAQMMTLLQKLVEMMMASSIGFPPPFQLPPTEPMPLPQVPPPPPQNEIVPQEPAPPSMPPVTPDGFQSMLDGAKLNMEETPTPLHQQEAFFDKMPNNRAGRRAKRLFTRLSRLQPGSPAFQKTWDRLNQVAERNGGEVKAWIEAGQVAHNIGRSNRYLQTMVGHLMSLDPNGPEASALRNTLTQLAQYRETMVNHYSKQIPIPPEAPTTINPTNPTLPPPPTLPPLPPMPPAPGGGVTPLPETTVLPDSDVLAKRYDQLLTKFPDTEVGKSLKAMAEQLKTLSPESMEAQQVLFQIAMTYQSQAPELDPLIHGLFLTQAELQVANAHQSLQAMSAQITPNSPEFQGVVERLAAMESLLFQLEDQFQWVNQSQGPLV